MEPVDEYDLTEAIAYALWRNHQARPRRKSLDETRHYARTVVAHLKLCGMSVVQRDPRPLHKTPE